MADARRVQKSANGDLRIAASYQECGGASVAHFQRFVSLTANIGRFSHDLADLQESMRSLRDMLATPSPVQFNAALTF
jgi:hypothetical protein